MKLYLSSYRLGDQPDRLKQLVGKSNARAAVSVNALDHTNIECRDRTVLRRELEDMESLGFRPEEIDLREYFLSESRIVERLKDFDLIWFSGGNVFLLCKAMRQAGFERVFDELVKPGRLVYAGYSAAFVAVSRSLRGAELVDDKDAQAEGYPAGEIWDGFGLIDFYPIVHFRSDHPESPLVEREYEYVRSQGFAHKTFRDGEVYIVNQSGAANHSSERTTLR